MHPARCHAMDTQTEDHSLGTVALVLGIVGFFVGLCSIAAIIVGVIARKKPSPEGSDQPKYAKIGLILGIVGVSLQLLALLLFVVVLAAAGAAAGAA